MYVRYYTRFFAVDVKGNPGFDQFVYAHSNCTCVLGITRFHRLVTRGSPVVSLRFTLGKDGVEDVKVGHTCVGTVHYPCFGIVCVGARGAPWARTVWRMYRCGTPV